MEAGANIADASRDLGHANVYVTLKIHTHAIPKVRRGTSDQMAARASEILASVLYSAGRVSGWFRHSAATIRRNTMRPWETTLRRCFRRVLPRVNGSPSVAVVRRSNSRSQTVALFSQMRGGTSRSNDRLERLIRKSSLMQALAVLTNTCPYFVSTPHVDGRF